MRRGGYSAVWSRVSAILSLQYARLRVRPVPTDTTSSLIASRKVSVTQPLECGYDSQHIHQMLKHGQEINAHDVASESAIATYALAHSFSAAVSCGEGRNS